MEKTDPGIAVSLGSAFLGYYAHSGFLSGLNQAGIFPGHLAGSSAGAMAAGFYASGFRGEALEKAILAPKLKQSFPDIGILARWIPMALTGRVTGFISGQRTIAYLKEHLPKRKIEECTDVKLHIAVTNLRNYQSEFLNSGPLAESMIASCAVPILFTEQRIGGSAYYDGGILHEAPIDPYLRDPSIHTIIIHRVTFPKTIRPSSFKIPQVMANSHFMLSDELMAYRCEEAKRAGKKVVLVETEHAHPGPFQTKAAKQSFFNKGLATGQNILGEIDQAPSHSARSLSTQ